MTTAPSDWLALQPAEARQRTSRGTSIKRLQFPEKDGDLGRVGETAPSLAKALPWIIPIHCAFTLPVKLQGDIDRMDKLIARKAQIVGSAILLGCLALASAHATDWEQLDSSDWSNAQDKTASQGTDQNVEPEGKAERGISGESGIAAGFMRLGMEQPRAECFESELSEALSPKQQQEAASLIASAKDAQEVRMAVLDAGGTMVGSFSAASRSCPK